MLSLALLLLACTAETPPGTPPGEAMLLAWQPERLVDLQLPLGNHPDGVPAPDSIPVTERFERAWDADGLEQYRVALPFGHVFFGHSTRTPPDGMRLLDQDGQELTYDRDREASPKLTTWRVRQGELLVRPARGEPAPEPGQLRLEYPPAAAWENGLDPSTSPLEGADFALRQVSLDGEASHGLLLPAPGSASWELELPEGAAFVLKARILRPGVRRGYRSDGASLSVSVEHQGQHHRLWEQEIGVKRWRPATIDLGAWSGKTVRLTITSEPGDDATLDRVFVANPTVYQPTSSPRHVVLIFADTVRRDHVGIYGYERDTTPAIDAWAQGAVVFDNARSTAPWTLPSVRTLLTGQAAGSWSQSSTLPELLGREGIVTAAIVNNAFLTHYFDMGETWCEYSYELLRPADEQVKRALAFLERHEDRDALVMLQLMDAHMPYKEPDGYRDRWAGEMPPELEGKIHRKGLRRLRLKDDREELVRTYLLDRYDQTIRFQDDELAKLLRAVGERATVVYFSDHGEEFYDHGSVEHGHTLYDELLRVPLILSAPGLEPGRIEAPVSLLDLTPTLLDRLGIPDTEERLGRSLLPLARGDRQAQETFQARPQHFGGLLYDDEAWGVLTPEGRKWVTRSGRQEVWDLTQDPGEQRSLARDEAGLLTSYSEDLAEAIARDVRPVWRLAGRGSARVVFGFEGRVELSHPAGIQRAWHPPSLTGDMAPVRVEDGVVRIDAHEGQWVPREVFVQPAGDPLEPTGLVLTVTRDDGESWSATPAPDLAPLDPDNGGYQRIAKTGKGSALFDLSLHVAPLPWDERARLGSEDAVNDHLRALGYLD